MASPFLFTRRRRAIWLGATLCVAACGSWGVSSARAQQQESGLLDRIEHPDRTLKNSMADKQFSTSSSVSGKQAEVRPFIFGRSSTFRTGDGTYNTRPFRGKNSFRTDAYATHTAATGNQGFSQTNKSFDTKSVDVHADRAANKAAPVQAYAQGEKPFLGRGTRQDTIDELRKQKDLTIDQVRELLNKNK